MTTRTVLMFALLISLVCTVCASAETGAELSALRARLPGLQVVALPAGAGELRLTTEQSLTVDDIRGVQLDERPPRLGRPRRAYDPRMTDDFPPGQAPYVARGIEPFRFRNFHCEFNYGGWHNYAMTDYAATHGFDILYPYVRKLDEGAHLPPGTKWLGWGGFINWRRWLPEHGIPEGRYDLLVGRDLVHELLAAGKLARPDSPSDLKSAGDYLMIDMEHGVLPPDKLRRQPWYPATDRQAFERRYYEGFAQTYISAVEAARQQGWRNISVYGWQPAGRIWFGLAKRRIEPDSYQPWQAYGKRIYRAVDLINNSVYCFYWSPQNVAYALANIDDNLKLVNSMPERKPVRPYFWTLLHGGGAGWRWWRGQPLPSEEVRAMVAMAFFTGIDGFDTWNWSGTGNHHLAPALTGKLPENGLDVMLKEPLRLTPEGAPADTKPTSFQRYDVLHITAVDEQAHMARFQKIQPGAKDLAVGDDYPQFAMPVNELRQHLRVKSEPVAAMIEGMALVKPFAHWLRHGDVKVDVDAHQQFARTLPIVRRVKLDGVHILITYDPQVIYGGVPRTITLNSFDGVARRTLVLPADQQTRIFVLREGA